MLDTRWVQMEGLTYCTMRSILDYVWRSRWPWMSYATRPQKGWLHSPLTLTNMPRLPRSYGWGLCNRLKRGATTLAMTNNCMGKGTWLRPHKRPTLPRTWTSKEMPRAINQINMWPKTEITSIRVKHETMSIHYTSNDEKHVVNLPYFQFFEKYWQYLREHTYGCLEPITNSKDDN